MTICLFWQPVKGKPFGNGNFTRGPLERAGLMRELTASDLPVLSGLEAAEVEGIVELKDAIYKHGRIRIWGEH